MSKTVSLYGGEVTLTFDPEEHCYSLSGTQAKPDGVTTILGLVPKYLLPWVARVTSDKIQNGLLERLPEGLDQSFIVALCNDAKKEHERAKVKAGGIGTNVHAFAESVFKTGRAALPQSNTAEFAGCQAFLTWWSEIAPRMGERQSERIIFSRRLFYAGTCDLFASIDGKPTVIDLKTGSGFYEDQPLQLAAYAMALEEELNIEIKDGWIIHLDKATGKCTPYFVELTKELKTDWEAVRIAWRAVKRNQERHKEIKRNRKCHQSTITTAAAQL